VLRDGVEAICIDGDDLGELVDAIEMLVSDTENRNRILSNGRQKVLSEFTSSRFANEMREKLSKLAG
jgi:glycosyltransferase involved in cell wall biosynthesis